VHNRCSLLLVVFAFSLVGPLVAHANVVPWMSGTFTSVPDILAFSHTAMSPDGKRDFSISTNLTVGAFTIISQQFCGGILCFEERQAPITGSVTGTITDATTHAVEQTLTERILLGHADYQDWFLPNPPQSEHGWSVTFVGFWDNGFFTGLSAEKLVSTTRPNFSTVEVTTMTPEPATLVMFAPGLFLCWLFLYRVQQRHGMTNGSHLWRLQHHQANL
jgi:hypothetical protein